MKKQLLIPVLAAAGGVLAMALRLAQMRTGFEAGTGLAIPGNAAGMALVVLLVVVAAVLALLSRPLPKLDKKGTFISAFGQMDTAALAAVTAGALLMALSGAADMATGLGMRNELLFSRQAHLIFGVLTLLSAGGIFLGAVACRKASAAFVGTPLLAAPVMLVLRLVLVYRVNSADPTLAVYYIEILAIAFLTLGFFFLSTFAFGDARPRAFALCAACAVVLAMASLGEWSTRDASVLALYAGGGVALLGFLIAFLRKEE